MNDVLLPSRSWNSDQMYRRKAFVYVQLQYLAYIIQQRKVQQFVNNKLEKRWKETNNSAPVRHASSTFARKSYKLYNFSVALLTVE